MSLEIAVTNGRSAIVMSDGLEWNGETGSVVSENSRKQIELGENIILTGGGYPSELKDLFHRAREAYDTAPSNPAAQLAAVRDEFHRCFNEKPFPGFGKTCLGGILVARDNIGFLLIKQPAGGTPEIHRVAPGGDPVFEFCGPGTLANFPPISVQFVLGGMAPFKGATPAQTVANLRAIFQASHELDPKHVNLNLRVSCIGDEAPGAPCEPDPIIVGIVAKDADAWRRALERESHGACDPALSGPDQHGTEAGARSDNAINQNGEFSNDAGASNLTTETVVAWVKITTTGGSVEIFGKGLHGYTSSNLTTYRLRKAASQTDVSGTQLDQVDGVNVNGTIIFLEGIDSSPSAEQYYVITGQTSSGTTSLTYRRLIAANRKK